MFAELKKEPHFLTTQQKIENLYPAKVLSPNQQRIYEQSRRGAVQRLNAEQRRETVKARALIRKKYGKNEIMRRLGIVVWTDINSFYMTEILKELYLDDQFNTGLLEGIYWTCYSAWHGTRHRQTFDF